MGDSSTIVIVTEHLASVDHRFSLASPVADNKATMTYLHDVLNNGSPKKKHKCQIRFVVGHLENLFIVKNLPLLPIQLILHRQMQISLSRSEKRQKKSMANVIAISKAYLRLPNLPPPVWSLTFAERPLFLDFLAKITAAFPDAADVLTHLHPVLSPTATDVSSLSPKERRELIRSETIFAATSTLSSCIHQLGHECFLAGPGYVPWYIMGAPTVPSNIRVDFLVVLHNDNSLVSLKHILCQQGVIEAKYDALQCSMLAGNGNLRSLKVTLEEIPLSMGLRPGESTGTDYKGISIINPSYLFSTMLTSISSRGLPMKKNMYNNVVEALDLLRLRNADVRATFKDTAELDELVRAYGNAHPRLRPYFTDIGFGPALLAILPTPLPEVDVHTSCDPTPTVRLPENRKSDGLMFQAAVNATRLLRDSGYSCAIFGSTAFYLHGIKHQASTLDILVSSSEEAETVNRCLVGQDPHFYLQKRETRGGTYQVLIYQQYLHIEETIVSKRTQVNIVMAGTMLLPFLLGSTIVMEGLPLLPLEVLLLLKLHAWHHHMTTSEPYNQRKLTTNVADIRQTLKVVLLSLTGTERSWACVALSFFQEEFRRLTMNSVKFFCSLFADCRDDWYQLGFEVV
ncbi:hypothetical protein F5146DRAFT_1076707 [Armillaria mellea]|nr:hypothetical protein F5146DRAFT_1076707 [Armillaria mellea]